MVLINDTILLLKMIAREYIKAPATIILGSAKTKIPFIWPDHTMLPYLSAAFMPKSSGNNAVKYGATEINIELDTSDQTFLLSIKDNGKGISPKEHTAIFEKFYRSEKGNLHTTKGLGLGLFYVKQLTDAYKGDLKIISEENKGALFLISIPL